MRNRQCVEIKFISTLLLLTNFPEKLAEDHVLSWSNANDVVFDPMCGSGTTCKMAQKHNRHYIGCDISNEYVEIAIARINKHKTESILFNELYSVVQ